MRVLDAEALHVQRLERRLRRGLAEADRHGRVVVRAVAHGFRHEQVALHARERLEHGEVGDAAVLHGLDQALARGVDAAAHSSRPQLEISCTSLWFVRSRCSGVTEM